MKHFRNHHPYDVLPSPEQIVVKLDIIKKCDEDCSQYYKDNNSFR